MHLQPGDRVLIPATIDGIVQQRVRPTRLVLVHPIADGQRTENYHLDDVVILPTEPTPEMLDAFKYAWARADDARLSGDRTRAGLRAVFEILHAQLHENEPTPETAGTRCPKCGSANGEHGLVHTRHGNGGGSNHPCPRSTEGGQA